MYPDDGGPPSQLLGSVLSIEGAVVTGQLLDRAFTGPQPVRIGDLVGIPAGADRVFGVVHSLRKGRRIDDKAVMEIHLLGESLGTAQPMRFRRGVSVYPGLDALIYQATQEELVAVYAQPTAASVRIGVLRHNADIPAYALVDGLLGKHFAILGSTGSGKSCAVTVVLRAIIEAHPLAHIVVVDPHDEYAAAFGDLAQRLDPSTLELPYWLLNFDELAAILAPSRDDRGYAEGAILKDAIYRARLAWLGPGDHHHLTVDTPVPYRLSDLEKAIDEAMGALDKPEGATPYRHLLARLRSVRRDPRYGFIFQCLHVRDSMAAVLGRLFRIPVAGKPVTLIDISAIPSEVVDVIVSLLCRLCFEFGLWSDRGAVTPLLLVCEEAHRYVPAEGTPSFEPSRRAIGRIAKEGRKYGVSLCLVSQRPAELAPTSLSQCGTIIALRMSNERDQSFVRNVLPDGSEWLIRSLPALGTGEAVVIGEGASVPMQVQFDPLDPAHQPASQTPAFSRAWRSELPGPESLAATVGRWRHLRR
jgi:DNA helicase HerA-like ATPase